MRNGKVLFLGVVLFVFFLSVPFARNVLQPSEDKVKYTFVVREKILR